MNNIVKINGNANALDTMNKNGISTTGNTELDSITKNIYTEINSTANSQFKIAVMLDYVKENSKAMFKNTNFKNIEDYGNTLFGFKKAYIYKLINITRFLEIKETVLDGSGTTYTEIIPKADSDGYSFNISQLVEFTRLSDTQLNENISLFDAGDTCKAIREKVDKILGKSPKEEKENNPKDENSDSDKKSEKVFTIKTDEDRINAILEIAKGIEDDRDRECIKNAVKKIIEAHINK